KPAGPSKAQLKTVNDLEAKLSALEAAHAKAQARLEARRAALEREAETLDADQAAARRRVEVALNAARQALG
ncbi:MAG: hypothetical protein ABW360_07690, partial [Phenylobacterium sp.]